MGFVHIKKEQVKFEKKTCGCPWYRFSFNAGLMEVYCTRGFDSLKKLLLLLHNTSPKAKLSIPLIKKIVGLVGGFWNTWYF